MTRRFWVETGLAAIRDALLPKVVSGKLGVKEAEAVEGRVE